MTDFIFPNHWSEERKKAWMDYYELRQEDPTNPKYYKMGIEPMDYAESHNFNMYQHNILKYITRYHMKNGLEDLHKAKWYLERLIEKESDDSEER
tara:strand:+ start:193 stop:477 length:285 start_codon:yes stop_codon:yes gene_type:complete